MNRGAKLIAGVLVLAAVAGLGWWLLGMQDDDMAGGAARGATTNSDVSDAVLPTAAASPDANSDAPAPESLTVADTAAAASTAPGNALTFTGRVVDASGRPVKDAEVVHLPSDPLREAAGLDWRTLKGVTPWDRFVRARTDVQGRFSLPSRELPLHGAPVLDIDTDGRGMTRGGIDGRLPRLLVQHQAFEPKLFTAFAFARGESDVGDLVVTPCGVVVGRCVDKEGAPLADVPIGILRTGQPMMDYALWSLLWNQPHTTSGADGRFVFGGLWNLELNLEFARPDFVPRREKVTVVAGQTVDLGDVVLDRGGEISGWVVSAAGAPLPGARLTLKPKFRGNDEETGPDAAAVADAVKVSYSGSMYELYATAAQDGSFRFAGVASLKNTPWRLVAAADGYDAAMLDPVAAGDPPARLALQPAGSLLLRIVEPGSATPVANARVQGHRSAVAMQWGDHGKMALPLVVKPEGEAWRLLGAGAANDALVSAPGHATTGFTLPAVPPGDSVEHRVELPAEAVLAGHVVDEQGAAVPRATLRARPPTDVPVKLDPRTARADAQGAFRIDALCAGEWTLLPAAEGFVVAEPVPVTLKAGEHAEELVVKLARGGSIVGRVLRRDPATVPGLQVLAEPADAVPPEVMSGVAATMLNSQVAPADVKSVTFKAVADDRGEYALRGLPAGTYHVGSWSGPKTDVVVKSGEESRLDITIHEPPRLHGRVTLAGAPVEGAKVVLGDLVFKYWDEVTTTTTDAGGNYALTLGGEGEGYGTEIFARFKDWKTRSVKVAPRGDEDLQVDLAFPGGTMVGELVDEEGNPVLANVHWHCNAREGFLEGDEVDARADTDNTGQFRLENLPDGTGPLMISKSPYIGIMQDETVSDGRMTHVPRIVMRKGCQLEVHVGGSGNPQDPMQRYLVRVRSIADPTWHGNELHVNFGQTTTFRGIPAGAIEIDVLKPVSPVKFEPLRTVQAKVQLESVTRFDQPVDS